MLLLSLQQMVGIPSTKKRKIPFSIHIGFLLPVINLLIHYCIFSIRGWGGRVENICVAEASVGRLFMFQKYFCHPTVLYHASIRHVPNRTLISMRELFERTVLDLVVG